MVDTLNTLQAICFILQYIKNGTKLNSLSKKKRSEKEVNFQSITHWNYNKKEIYSTSSTNVPGKFDNDDVKVCIRLD